MIVGNLHHGKECRHCRTSKIPAAIAQYDTSDSRRNIGKSDEFPYMPGTYYNDEIGGESIGYSPYEGYIPPHPHSNEHYEEPHHHHGYER